MNVSRMSDDSTQPFVKAFVVVALWVSVFILQYPFRVKDIEVDDEGMWVSMGEKSRLVPFSNISSVSKLELSNPNFITVRYVDPDDKTNNTLFYAPHPKHQRMMKDEMFDYIKEQSMAHNPQFKDVSTIKNLGILLLAGLPVLLLVLYFLSQGDPSTF